ncbi:MAG: hypothetical protein HC851_20190 [Acaryochloris sp. RU_4_1]|nr:hypothetical protein [Acaryochloris sp. RU_4_1]NJR56516.1 hypothetical protein [Acaryochloris sp. CRU_2_0]
MNNLQLQQKTLTISVSSLDPPGSSPESIFQKSIFSWIRLNPNIYTVKVVEVVCLSLVDRLIAPFQRYSHVVLIESEGRSEFIYVPKGESVASVLGRIEECAKSAREALKYQQDCVRLEESLTSGGYQLCEWNIDPSQAQTFELINVFQILQKERYTCHFRKTEFTFSGIFQRASMG